jgi:hypothetical protein
MPSLRQCRPHNDIYMFSFTRNLSLSSSSQELMRMAYREVTILKFDMSSFTPSFPAGKTNGSGKSTFSPATRNQA